MKIQKTHPIPTPSNAAIGPWRMIVCDLDGTLISRTHKVSAVDQAAIKKARSAGLHVTICTGRSTMESIALLSPLDLSGEGVFVNGATVSDLADGATRLARGLSAELVLKLVDFFSHFGHAVLLLVDAASSACLHYVITSHGPIHAATEEWLLRNKLSATEMNEHDACRSGTILRVGIVVDVPQSQEITDALAAQFGRQISFLALRAPLFDSHVIEVFGAEVNKWSGIEVLCNRMNVDPRTVVTIGDDVNDLPMLQNAGLSFAMGNALDEVKAAAKRITLTQSQNGVAAAIAEVLAQCAGMP